jgi:hypothetical protein
MKQREVVLSSLSRYARSHRLYIAGLVFFILLAFITLHAILFNTGTLVAGYDYFNYNWDFWWIHHATTTPGLNVYMNSFVMAPFMNNFGYHALTAFWYPVWALVEPVAGTLTAMNVIIFIGCVLNGYMLFVFLLREKVHPALALLGGAVLQVSPISRYFYYNTHINLMDWFWLPTHLLLWGNIVRAVSGRRWRAVIIWAVVEGIALWATGHTDLQFPIFVAFVLVPYGLWTLWQSRPRTPPERLTTSLPISRTQVSIVGAGVIVLIVAVVLLWFIGPLPYMRQFTGTLTPGTVEDRPGIPFPGGFLSTYPVWWLWNVPTMGGFVTVALLASVVVSFTQLRKKLPSGRWFWLLVALPPMIFAMGPNITLFGATIPMPYRLLFSVTNGMLRMPWRLGPIFIVAAVIFICLTWTPLLPRLLSRRVFAITSLFLLLALDIRLYETAPLAPVLKPYQFYDTIGAEQGEKYDNLVLLEVPTGAGTGEILVGDERVITFQYYGMRHHKRTLNGFISRAPLEHFWYIRTDDPMLSWLGQRRLLEADAVEAQLRQRITEWPIGYIVIHQDYVGLNGSTNQEIIGYLNSLPDLVCPVYVEGDALVYRTTAHPDGCPPRTPPEVSPGAYQIDIGTPDDVHYIGWGWHWREDVPGLNVRWTGQYPETKLYVDLPPVAYKLTLSVQAFDHDRELEILVNGQSLGTQTVPVASLTALEYEISDELVGDGQHITITLAYDGTDSAAALGLNSDERPLALMVDTIRFSRMGD